MDDKLTITLWINDQQYRMLIPREDEYLYREAAKQIQERINKFRRLDPGASAERIFSMAAFEISYENISMKDRNDTKPYIDKIQQWSEEMDECLNEDMKRIENRVLRREKIRRTILMSGEYPDREFVRSFVYNKN